MKTIMVNDVVYRKLSVIKGDMSFSKLLNELVEESKVARRARFQKYFGSIGGIKADAMNGASRRIRKELMADKTAGRHICRNRVREEVNLMDVLEIVLI